MLAAGVDGKSVHARVARSGWPASTWTVNVRTCPAPACANPGSSVAISRRVWPAKYSALSSSTRPQPWQASGTGPAPVPVIACVELSSVALTSAALGANPPPATAAPVG